MKHVSTKIFTPNIEEGRYFIAYDNSPHRKEVYIFRTERTQYKGRFPYNRDTTYQSYYRKLYELYSGFGGVRSHLEGPCNILRAYRTLKSSFVHNWKDKTYYSEFYELSRDEVEKYLIMEQL